MLTRTAFPRLCGLYNVRTGTDHRMVCRDFGACVKAICKGAFYWHCKMAGKFWVGQKDEKPIPLTPVPCFIYLYHAAHCSCTFSGISGFVDLSQQACSVTSIHSLWEWNFCHLEHADIWLVVVIVLVMMMMMMMMMIIIIMLTIMIEFPRSHNTN